MSYGRGLEIARERLYQSHGAGSLARVVLGTFRHERVWRPLFTMARAFRATRLPGLFAGSGRLGFQMAMLGATQGLGEGVSPSPRATADPPSPSFAVV